MNVNDRIVVVGDFNLPGISWFKESQVNFIPINCCYKSRQFLQSIFNLGLFQFCDMKNIVNNVLDLVFCDSLFSLNVLEADPLITPVDVFHVPLKLCFNLNKNINDFSNKCNYDRDLKKKLTLLYLIV